MVKVYRVTKTDLQYLKQCGVLQVGRKTEIRYLGKKTKGKDIGKC